jgi:hypothetical protein
MFLVTDILTRNKVLLQLFGKLHPCGADGTFDERLLRGMRSIAELQNGEALAND